MGIPVMRDATKAGASAFGAAVGGGGGDTWLCDFLAPGPGEVAFDTNVADSVTAVDLNFDSANGVNWALLAEDFNGGFIRISNADGTVFTWGLIDSVVSGIISLTPQKGAGSYTARMPVFISLLPPGGGAAGSGTFGQFSVDFTDLPERNNVVTVNVVDTAVTGSTKILLSHGGVNTSFRDADEAEMEPLLFALGTITPGAGFNVYVTSPDGTAHGLYYGNYIRS